MNKMKLSVPCNWDEALIDRLDPQNISEVYGKLKEDFIGGGRAASSQPAVQKRKAARHIKQLHNKGLKFDYLLNSACLGNREFTKKGRRQIRELLDWLALCEVDSVTVSIPYLLQVIKKYYPFFAVHLSSIAGVSTAIRARFWEDLGVEMITLPFMDTNINRDFEAIRRIRGAVKCRLQVIANCNCLNGCPFNRYHNAINSHASQNGRFGSGGVYNNYCSLSCSYLRFLEPSRFISSPWIRPEDAVHYESAGIDSLKILDRGMKTDYLVRIISAYSKRRYEGNLLDLFPFWSHAYIESSRIARIRAALKLTRKQAQEIESKSDIFLDNRKLDGFLDFFLSGKCKLDCQECGYCQKIAKDALLISDSFRDRRRKLIREALEGILS